ncbi:MAG: hypothetical protein H7062_13595 [Candidatus Saccharimonas sp.]|nr:hypothetical protein [Planctomycetaceae bacterium]
MLLCVLGADSLALGQALPPSPSEIPGEAVIADSVGTPVTAQYGDNQIPAYQPMANAYYGPTFSTATNRISLAPYWDHGLRFISADEQINLHVGGNVQWDSVWLNGSDSVLGEPSSNATSTTNSGASLPRRARIKFDGNIYDSFDYSLEFDLANAVNENKGQEAPTQDNVTGSPFPCNVWMQLRHVPYFGHVRIGNQVKPIGMTNNTYQGFLPFMERADNMDGFYGTFDEGFNPGISSINWTESERVTWRYGVFRPLKNAFGIGVNNYTVSGRVTALPIFEENGARLLHVGFGASHGSLVNNEFRVRARPALRNGPGYAVPVIVDTGTLPGTNQFLIGPELAAVFGPLTFQAEWTGQFISDAEDAIGNAQGTAFFHGGYAQVLYFLTGEHQAYEKKEGIFGRVVPHNSVRFGRGPGGGSGAWQVGCRLSYLDLTNKAINGGQITDMTLGLNWFLNPNMKIQANYLLANRDGQQGAGSGWFNGLGVRAAVDF